AIATRSRCGSLFEEIEMHRWLRASTLIAACAALSAGALLAGPAAQAQGTLSSPASIRAALGIMSRVVAESGRLIAARRYDQLPRESNEFEAGLIDLEQGLGNQPALREKLEPLVGKARIASSAMSEAVGAHRDSMIPLTHEQLADAVSEIIASFPASLRPTGNPRS
ncbi:MAG: hypothetical protein ACREUG_16315, partial [Steroidobacteraceae bacterium]